MNRQTEQLARKSVARSTQEWQRGFVVEWQRLAEGCADLDETADLALELYATHGPRDPAEVAREEWGTTPD